MHTACPRLCGVAFAILILAVLGLSPAWAGPVAQNQCPGDCSPCLGPTDPFCASTGDGGSGSGSSTFCVLCESPTGGCRDARLGETGKDDSCTVILEGNTVVSCTDNGNPCQGTSVTP